MSSISTLLSTETRDLTLGIGGWWNVANASLRRQLEWSPYPTVLYGDTLKNSLRVQAVVGGDVQVATEKFATTVGKYYKDMVWVYADAAYGADMELRFYDAGNTSVSDVTTSFTLEAGKWTLISALGLTPEGATQADCSVTIKTMAANERVFLANATAFQFYAVYTYFLERLVNILPDYLYDEDREIEGYVNIPLTRWLASATTVISQATQDAINFRYVRATEGTESLSTLTDAYTAKAEWLGWLAQQVGVKLSLGDTLLASWEAFEDGNILTWTQWEEDVVTGGTGPDTTWVGIENYDYSAVATALADFRQQIASGYNGIMSSSVGSMVAYLGSVLTSPDDEPWVFVRKHYKGHPFKQAVVHKVGESTDTDALSEAMSLASPAATKSFALEGVKYSAASLWDASDWETAWSSVLATSGYTPIPLTGSKRASFIEDATLRGRHIALWDEASGDVNPAQGGGVARASFYEGHAFYPGAVEATTASHANLNILGDIDIRVLISDIRLWADHAGTTDNIISSENKWSLILTDTGFLKLEWTEAGPTTLSATSSVALDDSRSVPQWIRATLDVDNGASGHTVNFYTANNLTDGWTELGVAQTTAGTTDIITNATNFLQLFDKTTTGTPATSWANCVIYRAMVHTGIDGSAVADINFTNTLNSNITPGTISFTEDSTNSLAVTISGATSGDTGYQESRWRFIQHSGTDLFHFGSSPFKEDAGTASLGDTLAVNMGSSDTYYWTITYADDTTDQNSETTTTITWDADDYGGTLIKDITVRTVSHSGTIVAQFLPALVSGMDTGGADSYSKTWTLTRAWEETAGNYYEPSAFVDRSYFLPVENAGRVYAPLFPEAGNESFRRGPFTYLMIYRRQWNTAVGFNGSPTPFYSYIDFPVVDDGFSFEFSGDFLSAWISDGIYYYYKGWDEDDVGDPRTGEWNLVALRGSPTENKVEFVANGDVTLLGEFFPNQYLQLTGETTDYASAADYADLDQTAEIYLQVLVELDDWTTDNGVKWLMSKGDAEGNLAYQIGIRGTGTDSQIHFGWYDSSNVYHGYSSNNTGITSGKAWLYVWFDGDGGAGGNYYISFRAGTTPRNVSQVSDATGASASDMRSTTGTLQIPAVWHGITGQVDGKLYRAKIGPGDPYNLPSASTRFDANFQDTTAWTPQSATGVEASNNAETVTLNGNISVQRTPVGSEPPADVTFSDFFRTGNENTTAPDNESINLATLAYFDHYLDDDLIAALMAEESIS